MMESEEITKLVDGIYKNVLDKFNPGTRQMINAGKGYLKALHGAAAASRVYVDAITKLARQAQQATWSGCSDIGSALMQIVEVYKETQAQQMNILKAFYVDVLVPLETNLEKDTKVIQIEQKKFLQEHKQHMDSYRKAETMVKKYRKKQQGRTKGNNTAVDKELKSMQLLEQEKNKLDDFCEQSLKNAMTEERRRYGFVLERQCSLGKHFLAFHNNQQVLLDKFINSWMQIAQSREQIPEPVENMFACNLRQVNFYADDEQPSSPTTTTAGKCEDDGDDDDEDDVMSSMTNTQLRKTKSVDTAGGGASAGKESPASLLNEKQRPLVRAKSDFNMNAMSSSSTLSVRRDERNSNTLQRPMSLALTSDSGNATWEQELNNSRSSSPYVKALFGYISNGENQLSFLKGDIIYVIGERNQKGWQYGENLRTKGTGWFPLGYTETYIDDNNNQDTLLHCSSRRRKSSFAAASNMAGAMYRDSSSSSPDADDDIFRTNRDNSPAKYSQSYKNAPVTRFGDSVIQRHLHQVQRVNDNIFSSVPPPVVPAPIVPLSPLGSAAPQLASCNTPPFARNTATTKKKVKNGNASLHSSNDSGFSNDHPPPAPDADYSDDDTNRHVLLKKAYELKMAKISNNAVTGNSSCTTAASPKTRHENCSVNNWLNGGGGTSQETIGRRPPEYSTTNRRIPIRQSSSVGQLATLGARNPTTNNSNSNGKAADTFDKKLKRTKSLWKFKKTQDDLLEGMSLWKHRSLVDINDAANSGDGPTNTSSSSLANRGTPLLNKRMSMTKEIAVDDDTDDDDDDDDVDNDENETIMNENDENTTLKRNNHNNPNEHTANRHSYTMTTTNNYNNTNNINRDNNNYKIGNGRVSNIESDDPSDPESCIVVSDHHKKESTRRPPPAPVTMIPRMHLSKTNSLSAKLENPYKNIESDFVFESSKLQTFKYNRIAGVDSSWYDSWGDRRKK